MIDTTNWAEILNGFSGLKVMIIGDVMLDSYLWGKVERISPEAPVPVVSVNSRANRLGGAANVALNVKALGAEPFLCSVIGNDPRGMDFINLMNSSNIDTTGIIQSDKRITTTKFRIIGNNTQMLRVDEENDEIINNNERNQLFSTISRILAMHNINVIIFEDYDKGVIDPVLILKVVELAKTKNIPVSVDPKKRNFLYYQNVSFFKPNLKELHEGLKLDFNPKNPKELQSAVEVLIEKIACQVVMVTLSEEGVCIHNKDMFQIIPAHKRSVADVSGAGDTVISVASLCLALNLEPEKIAYISNIAGGIVCEEVGVVPIQLDKLKKELERKH